MGRARGQQQRSAITDQFASTFGSARGTTQHDRLRELLHGRNCSQAEFREELGRFLMNGDTRSLVVLQDVGVTEAFTQADISALLRFLHEDCAFQTPVQQSACAAVDEMLTRWFDREEKFLDPQAAALQGRLLTLAPMYPQTTQLIAQRSESVFEDIMRQWVAQARNIDGVTQRTLFNGLYALKPHEGVAPLLIDSLARKPVEQYPALARYRDLLAEDVRINRGSARSAAWQAVDAKQRWQVQTDPDKRGALSATVLEYDETLLRALEESAPQSNLDFHSRDINLVRIVASSTRTNDRVRELAARDLTCSVRDLRERLQQEDEFLLQSAQAPELVFDLDTVVLPNLQTDRKRLRLTGELPQQHELAVESIRLHAAMYADLLRQATDALPRRSQYRLGGDDANRNATARMTDTLTEKYQRALLSSGESVIAQLPAGARRELVAASAQLTVADPATVKQFLTGPVSTALLHRRELDKQLATLTETDWQTVYEKAWPVLLSPAFGVRPRAQLHLAEALNDYLDR